MAQAMAGSQSAFEQILRRYQRPVLSLSSAADRRSALAEDLAQETFVKAFRNLAAFDSTAPALQLAVPHRPQHSHRRAASKAPTVALGEGAAAIDAPHPLPPIRSSAGARTGHRRRAGDRCARTSARRSSCATRTGCRSRRSAGCSGMPEATARSHVHRARKELVRQMTEAGWTPGR